MIKQFLSSVWGDAVFWFVGLWAVLLFIRHVFKDADEDLDPEKRQLLAAILTSEKIWASESWIPNFTLVFDRFFGQEHLTWRCFVRSILISMVTFFVLAFCTDLASEYHKMNIIFSQMVGHKWPVGYFEVVSTMILAGLIINGLQDYLSLLETRILLNTPLPITIKILVDMFLTLLIPLAWLSLFVWSGNGFSGSYLGTVRDIWELFAGHTEASFGGQELGVFRDYFVILFRVVVATSFTTSIWLWLHGLAQLTIQGLNGAKLIISWLNVKNKPLRAIGTTINVFALVTGIVLFPIFAFAG